MHTLQCKAIQFFQYYHRPMYHNILSHGIMSMESDQKQLYHNCLTYSHMGSWFTGIVLCLCINTTHSNAARIYAKIKVNCRPYENKRQLYENKFCKKIIQPPKHKPLKPIFNQKLQARTVTMTESILCSSMVFHSILRANSMDNSPARKC